MGKTRHEKSFVDFEQPYERNIIGLRGIVYFSIGLFLLIVITFGLMWFLNDVMEEQAIANDAQSRNPMALNEIDRLPPEPRLQTAPGFGVDTGAGRVNLELVHPQAEWEVLQQEYREIWEKGQTAPDGTAVTLPIDQAKQRFLEEKSGSPANGQNQNVFDESRLYVSDASSGRQLTVRRR
jgi:hypothetical protein